MNAFCVARPVANNIPINVGAKIAPILPTPGDHPIPVALASFG
jgi:hypothetical protein